MFRAMAIKEFRETRAILLFALAAFVYLVVSQVYPWLLFSRSRMAVPFVQDAFLPLFICITGAATIGLGLRQTLGESIGGTYPFLLHRPARRQWLIGVKLLVGIVGYLVLAAMPIVAYGLWAATPGTHASPFQWSMTAPSWFCYITMPLLYLGAFLTGLRPAGWYKSAPPAVGSRRPGNRLPDCLGS